MKSYDRWVDKHRSLAFILIATALCTVYTCLLSLLNAHFVVILLIDALLIFSVRIHVSDFCKAKLVLYAAKDLTEHCDPDPFKQELENQLASCKNDQREQLLRIDLCVALVTMGEYQLVLNTLNGINIDKFPGTLPFQKCIYYNNLADVCTKTNRFESADAWYQKAAQIYADLKNKKQRKAIFFTMETARAFDLYRKNEYSMALDVIQSLKCENLLQKVENSFFRAQCHIALNQTDSAREALCFVIANGNKTCFVKEAEALLQQLS